MKKHLPSFINLLAVTLSLTTFAMPVATQAQVVCPAGYTCSPIQTTPGCPTGYICTPTDNGGSSYGGGGGGGGGGTVIPTTDTTVTVNGTPTLALTYDFAHKESALTATFDVTVTGGTRAFYVLNGAPVTMTSAKYTQYPNGILTPVTYASSTSSTNYGQVYVIAPGQSTRFTITASGNPAQMFAGTYTASLSSLIGTNNLYDTTGNLRVVVPPNQTNSKTIVGERSPYISSMSGTQPFVPGQSVNVVGERLNTSGGVTVDGTRIPSNLRGDEARNITITLPSSLANGFHTLQITSSTNGASNQYGFQTQSSNGTCYTFSTNLSLGSTGPDVIALQNWLLSNGYHIAAVESGRQPKGYYGNQTADAVAAYQASLGIRERQFGYAYVGPLTRAALNGNCTVTPPVTTVTCPAGYVCTPAGQSVTCPAGYVCTTASVATCPDGYTCYTVTAANPSNGGGGGGGYVFSTNLNLGSTGPDVVALQTWLIANGYNIPNIASGSTAKGYYDFQTAAAVLQFQTAVGIIESGVGPLTRAKLNSGSTIGTTTTTTCPTGYICTTVPTNPPVSNTTVSFQAVFNKTFNLNTVPSVATLGLAADNNYIAYVNGQYVGAGRSEAAGTGNNNFDNLTNFNVAQYLHTGSNTISITGQNYYSTATSWPNNAFGLLYKLTDQNSNILAASDGTESIGSATIGGGSSVVLSQPHPWYIRPSGASWIWDSADPLYATYLSYTGQTNPVTPPSVSGKLIPSLASTPGDGVILSPGQTAAVAAYNLQSGSSAMSLQSMSFDFNVRPWLYASVATIKDMYGNSIAQLNLSNSTASEIAVGTDYRITIPINNLVILPNLTRTFTLVLSGLSPSDRQSGPVSIIQAQTRAVDGTGVIDPETTNATRTFQYQAAASNTSVAVSLDASSPVAGLVQISTSAQTQNVPLLTFDLNSQNAPTNLQAVVATVNTTGQSVASIFSNLSMKIGSQTYGVQAITNGNSNSATAIFSNFGNVTLPANTVVPVTIFGTVAQDTNSVLTSSGAAATVQVSSSGITAQDASYNNVSAQGSANGNRIAFTSSSVTTSNLSATLGSAVLNQNTTVAYNTSFSFTLTAGNQTLYVSANPGTFVATSITGNPATGNLPIAGMSANPAQVSGDNNVTSASGYYVIPAGTSRQFTFAGSLVGTSASYGGLTSWQITQINYGTSPSNVSSSNLTSNLLPLKITATGISAPPTAPSVTPTDSASYKTGGSASTQNSSLTAAIWDAIRAYYAH